LRKSGQRKKTRGKNPKFRVGSIGAKGVTLRGFVVGKLNGKKWEKSEKNHT